MTLVLTALLVLAGAVTPRTITRLPTAATIEKIPLARPPGAVTIDVDPLNARITLTPQRDPVGLAGKIGTGVARLCPEVRVVGAAVVLQCQTRRIDGMLVVTDGKLHLEIQELRGLPWRSEQDRLDFRYDHVVLGLGPCPGVTAAQRGECALKQGRLAEAALEFRKALDGDGKTLGAMRLGDIAVRQGDPATAAGWYQIAGWAGLFGRMAQARLCELGGWCLGETHPTVFDTVGVPEPARSELQLRAARVAAYAGRPGEMVRLLTQVLGRRAVTSACDQVGALFCRRLVLHALEQPGTDGALEALELYLQLPRRGEGPLSVEMVRAAAEKAAALKAPVFGGNLLAGIAAMIPPADLPEHLLRAAELYLVAGDRPRARIIAEYAETKVGRKQLASARWHAVISRVQHFADAPSEPVLSPLEALITEGAADLAAAYGARARARSEKK